MTDGVAAGTPLAFLRNRTSALASIAAIGLDLPIRGHGEGRNFTRLEGASDMRCAPFKNSRKSRVGCEVLRELRTGLPFSRLAKLVATMYTTILALVVAS